MNAWGAAFLAVAAALTLLLPRRLAVLPLLMSAAYMTSGQALHVLDANLTLPRLLVAVGLLRVLLRREHLPGGLLPLDRLLLAWGAVLLGMSFFHAYDGWVFRSGIVWGELGAYFLMRRFLRDLEDVRQALCALCVLMVPLAALMLLERLTGDNPFLALGGVKLVTRDGAVRAGGPFNHPILAGTTGAALLGMAWAIRRSHRLAALAGATAGAVMVLASKSSGPVLMAACFGLAVAAWPLRARMAGLRWTVVTVLGVLSWLMTDPVYFLAARLDVAGGSQGYFRAQLIRSALEHLGEWWATGTDHTRHWMDSGIYANDRHTDITNHLLWMGVMGGLPLLAIFVAVLVRAFGDVGRALRAHADAAGTTAVADQALRWALGALLFAFLMNFLSITLFDQSVLFFYLLLAAIQAASVAPDAREQALPAPGSAAPTPGAAGAQARPLPWPRPRQGLA